MTSNIILLSVKNLSLETVNPRKNPNTESAYIKANCVTFKKKLGNEFHNTISSPQALNHPKSLKTCFTSNIQPHPQKFSQHQMHPHLADFSPTFPSFTCLICPNVAPGREDMPGMLLLGCIKQYLQK